MICEHLRTQLFTYLLFNSEICKYPFQFIVLSQSYPELYLTTLIFFQLLAPLANIASILNLRLSTNGPITKRCSASRTIHPDPRTVSTADKQRVLQCLQEIGFDLNQTDLKMTSSLLSSLDSLDDKTEVYTSAASFFENRNGK